MLELRLWKFAYILIPKAFGSVSTDKYYIKNRNLLIHYITTLLLVKKYNKFHLKFKRIVSKFKGDHRG
jgi:hypothetical protein